jgi:hypothetical protein
VKKWLIADRFSEKSSGMEIADVRLMKKFLFFDHAKKFILSP